MSENQLQIIVKESGLDSTKAKFILENFQNYFELASEWETKAKTIIVTSEDQKEMMGLAKEGRMLLRGKRLAVENSRKVLKEQSLREGKAIDGIANILKALIVPIEEYFESQERFVEIQEEKKIEARRLEIEQRMAEEDRVRAEKAAKEQERVRLENEKLKKEAQEQERKFKEQEAERQRERDKADAERRAIEDKAKAEKVKAETEISLAEEKAKKEKERAAAKLKAEREENQRLEELLKNQIECPSCHHKFQLKGEK